MRECVLPRTKDKKVKKVRNLPKSSGQSASLVLMSLYLRAYFMSSAEGRERGRP